MQSITLDNLTAYVDLYAMLGIPSTQAIILNHRGTGTFNLFPAATQPINTQTGLAVVSGTTIRVPGYTDGRTVWIRGGTGQCIVQPEENAIVPTSTVNFATDLFTTEKTFTGTSDIVVIRPGMTNVTVALHPQAGASARVEYTVSSMARVNANTARWLSWPMGDNTTARADSLLSTITAIRGISTGTAVMEVIAS